MTPSSDTPPTTYGGRPFLLISVEMLLSIHNEAAPSSKTRQMIVDYVQEYGARNEKAHWARAIVLGDNGTLSFSYELYDEAVYRGKQETYFAASAEAFQKLSRDLEMVSDFFTEEQRAVSLVPAGQKENALVPMREKSREVSKLEATHANLQSLVMTMKGGISETVSIASPMKASQPTRQS